MNAVKSAGNVVPSMSRGDISLTAIYEVSKILSSSLDLRVTLREVLSILSSFLDMQRGMISLVQDDGSLRLIAAHGLTQTEIDAMRFEDGGVTLRIFVSGLPVVVPNIRNEPLFVNRNSTRPQDDGADISFIGVPIRCNRETLGVLTVDLDRQVSQPNFARDARFLQMVANLIGQAARLAQLVLEERTELMGETRRLKKELAGRYKLDSVIGTSKLMQEVFAEVHQAAPGRTTVLLRGESGTGKEVIARSIHYLSPRKEGPFIKVNCAALSETLLESELFGHERGAFTGAHAERKGRFEQAHGGTLFLDEIGDISPAFQAKLLRVLQEREFERVGGNKAIKVDVRLICATNRDLEKAVAAGEFRSDLYYRINVVPIFLPPLRERPDDIPRLVEHFLELFNKENRRSLTVSRGALAVLTGCYWPGNVRELQNCIERAATMTMGAVITEASFPCSHNRCLTRTLHQPMIKSIPVVAAPPAEAPPEREVIVESDALGVTEAYTGDGRIRSHSPAAAESVGPPQNERDRLIWAMEKCGWVQAKAARVLGLTARQMGYALQKHQIPIKRF